MKSSGSALAALTRGERLRARRSPGTAQAVRGLRRQGLATLCALGRYDEAEEWARKSRELGARDDIITQLLWRQVLSKVKAHRRAFEEGERLAREAVELSEQTDQLVAIGLAHLDLAEVLEQAGRRSEAVEELTKALELFERKGDLPMAAQTRRHLEAGERR